MEAGSASILECPVCLEIPEQAKILDCLHMICLGCAGKLCNVLDNSISCPQCRNSTKVKDGNIENLKNDFRFLQLKEALQQSQPQCYYDTNFASHKCQDCSRYVCVVCSESGLGRTHFGHTLIPVDKITCSKHGRELDHICTKCPRLLCGICMKNECDEHKLDVQYLSPARLEIYKSKWKDYMCKLNKGVDNYDKLGSALRKNYLQQEEVKQAINDLDDHERKLIKEIRNRAKEIRQTLKDRSLGLSEVKNALEMSLEVSPDDQIKSAKEVERHGVAQSALYLHDEQNKIIAHTAPDMSLLEAPLTFKPEHSLLVGDVIISEQWEKHEDQGKEIEAPPSKKPYRLF